MSHVITLSDHVILETVKCCMCCMTFAMPQEVKRKRLDDKQTFYCPVGHTQSFTGTNVDKLRADLESARAIAADRAEALARSERTVVRLRKRLKAVP